VVSADHAVVRALEADLSRRFANDSRIVCAVGAEEGLTRLRKLAGRADPVALLIADQRMPGLTGVEFLERATRSIRTRSGSCSWSATTRPRIRSSRR
jgi:thioredoxin reductase (NADPH)